MWKFWLGKYVFNTKCEVRIPFWNHKQITAIVHSSLLCHIWHLTTVYTWIDFFLKKKIFIVTVIDLKFLDGANSHCFLNLGPPGCFSPCDDDDVRFSESPEVSRDQMLPVHVLIRVPRSWWEMFIVIESVPCEMRSRKLCPAREFFSCRQ